MTMMIETLQDLHDPALAQRLQHRLDRKTTPGGSLGRLEALALQIGLVLGSETPRLRDPQVLVCAGQEVLHHLPGDVAGIGRDAAGSQAMVAGAHQHLRIAQARGLAAQHQPDLQGQRLQAPERAQGLGLAVQLVLQALRQRGVVEVLQGFDRHGHEGLRRPDRVPAGKRVSMKSARPSKTVSSVGARAPNSAWSAAGSSNRPCR